MKTVLILAVAMLIAGLATILLPLPPAWALWLQLVWVPMAALSGAGLALRRRGAFEVADRAAMGNIAFQRAALIFAGWLLYDLLSKQGLPWAFWMALGVLAFMAGTLGNLVAVLGLRLMAKP